MIIEDITLLKNIGEGEFGYIYLSTKQGSKEKFAAKRIDKKFLYNHKIGKYIENEIKFLKEIDHPNLIKLFEVIETSHFLHLVTDYCNGGGLDYQLNEYLEKYNHPFTEEIVQNIMRQIISGIQYLHEKNIIHCKINLFNILLNFDSEKDRKDRNIIPPK